MRAVCFLLRRYLFPTDGGLLRFALWISTLGVALGIVQLMLVLAVMSGFQKLLRENYTRISSEMVVRPQGEDAGDPSFVKHLIEIPGIESVTPFSFGQAMLVKDGVAGVVLEGMDFETSKSVTPWESIWLSPPRWDLQKKNALWIWVGVQLARKLGVSEGDTVQVFIPDKKSTVTFTVTAITRFGIYEHDLRYARVELGVLGELLGEHRTETMYKCRLAKGVDAADVGRRVVDKLGSREAVKLWSDINRNLFLAVEHQKRLLFIILEIIIALAAMNVVNLLMMSSYHRRRDIAILRSQGMRLPHVFSFFVAQGALVGLVGSFGGVGLGYLACGLLERFQPTVLSESVYNVTRLPLSIELKDVLVVVAVALVLCVVVSLLPAVRAACSPPVKALRYE